MSGGRVLRELCDFSARADRTTQLTCKLLRKASLLLKSYVRITEPRSTLLRPDMGRSGCSVIRILSASTLAS